MAMTDSPIAREYRRRADIFRFASWVASLLVILLMASLIGVIFYQAFPAIRQF